MRISDWSSDVCSSDLGLSARAYQTFDHPAGARNTLPALPEVETLIDATQDPRCLDFARHERNHGADLSHNTLGGREPILLPIRLRINLDPACRINGGRADLRRGDAGPRGVGTAAVEIGRAHV